MKTLLQPCSGKEAMEHYQDTIERGVSIYDIKKYVEPYVIEKLKKLNQTYIKVWGIVPKISGEERIQWTNLEENDCVLFSANKAFFYFAKVHLKIHNKNLAEKLWGHDEKGRTWENIYFIKEGKQIQVPYDPSVIMKADGTPYASNHIIRGAILLRDENSVRLKNHLESFEGDLIEEDLVEPTKSEEVEVINIIKEPRTHKEAIEELKSIAEDISKKPIKERIKIGKILSRNPKFARLVKEKSKYICEICGTRPFLQKNSLPYAEAHHIFELSKSRIDDPKKMICVCPTCHKVIHYGNDAALEERKKIKQE